MKINYNISKNCLLTILLILPVLVHSQEQRFVKITGSTGYNDGNWTCWREGIRYSHQTLVNGSNVFLQHPNGSYGAIVDVGSSIGFRVVYSKDGTAHFSSKISVPPTYGSASIPRKNKSIGCVSCWADGTVYYYDAHDIEYIQDLVHGGGTVTGGNFCISSIDAELFKVKVGSVTNEYSSHSFYLIAEDASGNQLSSKYISSSVATSRNFSYKDIFGTNERYGTTNPVYFRILTDFGGTYYYGFSRENKILSPDSKRVGPFYFFRKMPAIVAINIQRTACREDVVEMTLDPSVIASINKYHFRAKRVGYPENTSNIVHLTTGIPSGNIVPLTVTSGSAFISGKYDFQVFGIETDANKKTDELGCAALAEDIEVPVKPSYLSITATPVLKDTFDGKTYHTSKHNLNDAVIHLAFNDRSRVAKVEMDYECNFSNDCRDIVNVTSQLQNVGFYTKSLSMNFDYHQMSFRVTDTDSCVSGVSNQVTLSKPKDITLNDPLFDTVDCHVNNVGKKTTTVKATFNGGIGEYIARLYNGSGSYIDYKNITDEDKVDSNFLIDFGSRPVGSYRINVTDKHDVSKEKYFNIVSYPELKLTASAEDLKCFQSKDGSIELTAINLGAGTPEYTLSKQIGSSTKYEYLAAGNYTATVTNGRECQATLPDIIVDEPDPIVINALGSKIARFGDSTGTINVNIAGGWTNSFNYELYQYGSLIESGTNSGTTIIDSLKFGDINHENPYKIIAYDTNSCYDTLYGIQVIQPEDSLQLFFTQQNVDCYGNATGDLYPSATGGWKPYQYGYNDTNYVAGNTISGLKASDYSVFVIDSAGVVEKLPVTITEPTQLITSVENTYNLKCFEDNSGAVKLNISGGTKEYRIKTDYTDWVNGDSISSLPIMDIEPVYVLDAHDCPSQVDVTITQPDKIAIVVDSVIDAFCGQDNGVISTLVSGGTEGYAFNWTYLDSLKSVPVNSNIIGGIYSGQYKLFLSDAHGCTDSLTVSVSDTDGPEILAYKIDTISCFGGSDGKLTIQQVDGGLPEYAYYLDGIEGDTTFERLENKTYHFRLLDKKGCKLDRYYIIPEPEDIAITGTVVNPVCHNSFDGFIATRIRGGNGGYVYRWSNNIKTKDLQNLNSGSYTLTVTDKKACEKSESFEVIPPLAPTAHLDHNVGVLCTGNSLELDGGDFISYQWYKDAVLVSQDRYLTVDQTGQYTLKISNQLGCIGVDTFDLEVSDTPLDATILLQDSAMVDEVVRAIDVTWPIPDSIQWYFDYPVELVEKNNYSQKFSSTNTGTINVTLRAWYGGCFSDSSKSVTIYYEEGGVPQKSAMYQPLILGYKAYPNPNDGDFHVGVELSRQADISLHLFNVGSGSAIDITRQYGLERYDVPFNLAELKPGVYVLVLVAEHEQQRLKVVIK